LNRGWRFCRFPRVGYVVDPTCLLLSADPSFYPVFGAHGRKSEATSFVISKELRLHSVDVIGCSLHHMTESLDWLASVSWSE
jgi:hypothetical protein